MVFNPWRSIQMWLKTPKKIYHSVTICTHVNTQKELHNQTLLLIPSIPYGLILDLNHTLILTLTNYIERGGWVQCPHFGRFIQRHKLTSIHASQATDTVQNRHLWTPDPQNGSQLHSSSLHRPQDNSVMGILGLSQDKIIQGQLLSNFKWKAWGYGCHRASWESVDVKVGKKKNGERRI